MARFKKINSPMPVKYTILKIEGGQTFIFQVTAKIEADEWNLNKGIKQPDFERMLTGGITEWIKDDGAGRQIWEARKSIQIDDFIYEEDLKEAMTEPESKAGSLASFLEDQGILSFRVEEFHAGNWNMSDGLVDRQSIDYFDKKREEHRAIIDEAREKSDDPTSTPTE